MIEITNTISIEESELEWSFIRASGPGGQNVNKVATAAQLRFDLAHSPSLPDDVRARATKLAGKRLTSDGVLIITTQRYRSQERNRHDAITQLVDLLRQAAIPPKRRRKTQPTRASKEKRLESKRQRSQIKRERGRVDRS